MCWANDLNWLDDRQLDAPLCRRFPNMLHCGKSSVGPSVPVPCAPDTTRRRKRWVVDWRRCCKSLNLWSLTWWTLLSQTSSSVASIWQRRSVSAGFPKYEQFQQQRRVRAFLYSAWFLIIIYSSFCFFNLFIPVLIYTIWFSMFQLLLKHVKARAKNNTSLEKEQPSYEDIMNRIEMSVHFRRASLQNSRPQWLF